MLVHGVPGQATDEIGLGAVGEWQRLGQRVEGFCADWTLCVVLFLLVALSEEGWLRVFTANLLPSLPPSLPPSLSLSRSLSRHTHTE